MLAPSQAPVATRPAAVEPQAAQKQVPQAPTSRTPGASPLALPASGPSNDLPGSTHGASDAVAVRPESRRPEAPRTTDDELARMVVGVFGDSSALHRDSITVDGDEPLWDIDVLSYETHERVAFYVKLFSERGRERFAARLSRGSRYEPMIRDKLRASGMPEDLTYLALIESGYDPHAYSRAAAVGMWQFMSGTARGVGLRVDWWMDERRDPVRATDAAIRFLGELQKQFGSLYLAAAAYNGGPGRVARGLERFAGEMEGAEGEDRFFALAEQNYLRAETKNYVPQLIAAAFVAKTPEKYGITVDSTSPLSYDSVRVDPGTSLSVIAAGTSATSATMKDLNPAILRGMTPPDTSVWVHVPTGTADRAAIYLSSIPAAERLGYRSFEVDGSKTSVGSFAEREGISAKQLRWFNPSLKTTRSGKLVAGQTLRIPDKAVFAFAREIPDPDIERYGGGSAVALVKSGVHVVRRGDNLGSIAKRYGMTVTRLRSLNGLRGTRVIPGQTLRVSSTRAVVAKSSGRGKAASTSKTGTARSRATSKAKSSGKGKSASTWKANSSAAKSAKSSKVKSSKSLKTKAKASKSSSKTSSKAPAKKKPATKR